MSPSAVAVAVARPGVRQVPARCEIPVPVEIPVAGRAATATVSAQSCSVAFVVVPVSVPVAPKPACPLSATSDVILRLLAALVRCGDILPVNPVGGVIVPGVSAARAHLLAPNQASWSLAVVVVMEVAGSVPTLTVPETAGTGSRILTVFPPE